MRTTLTEEIDVLAGAYRTLDRLATQRYVEGNFAGRDLTERAARHLRREQEVIAKQLTGSEATAA